MHARTGAVALAAGLLLAGCTGDDPTSSSTSPSASSSPAFEVRPVVGERVPSTFALAAVQDVLGLGSAPAPDEDAIAAAIDAVATWLDRHLDEVQRTGEGRLDRVSSAALRRAGDTAQVTTDLTSPDLPVRTAHYQLNAYHDGGPQWISALVEVTRADGSVATASMVFVIEEDGGFRLTMFGPAGDAGT